MDITELAAHELSRAIRAREVSCVETMRAYLARIDALNPRFNAIVSRQDPDALLALAGERDAQLARGEHLGWMHGLPQAIKDMSHSAGIATTLGSPLLRDLTATTDSLMTARMKAAGCIVVGKSNTPEFGLGSHTFNEVFGATRNAWDPSKSAGGSSGGAAVALALHMLPVADGSDFMGSLRNPAAWNNIFGLRPSQGRVPMDAAPDAWIAQLGTEGPMGRTVRDVALLLGTQAGWHPGAPLSLDGDGSEFAGPLEIEGKGLRIGWLRDLGGYLPMEAGVLQTCEQALGRLRDAGCEIEPASLDYPPEQAWQAWLLWRRALVASRIAPLLARKENRAQVKPEALWEYDQAQDLSAVDFLDASTRRTAFYRRIAAMFERFDFLALPSTQVWPFDVALRWPREIAGRAMDTYHRWMEVTIYATFAGLPALSVPAGFGAGGLPMGLQLIGPPRGDMAVLRLGHLYEQAAQEIVRARPPAMNA